ncbi:MAG: NACHT domain-containing protein [Stenotrophomonas sp.]|uniref:NACHT domain-containing protein n=1 Tax=Stenotrophomonas sp. TaxID=69392 RepID=UPI003D6D71C6
MKSINAFELLAPVLSNFRVKRSNDEVDVREAIALIDFHVRVIYTLLISFNRRQQGASVKLLPVPGFGSMLAVLRQGSKLVDEPATAWVSSMLRALSVDAIKGVDAFRVANKYSNFKSLRDRLSHGGTLPSDDGMRQKISLAVSALISCLERSLSTQLSIVGVSEQDGRLWLVGDEGAATFEVSPLWVAHSSRINLGVFSHFADDTIHYFGSDGELWLERNSELVARFRRLFLSEKGNPNQDLAKLVTDTLADVAAYTEDYSRPSFFFGDDERTGYLHIPWTRSTSEGNEPRIDAFRIGLDHRREWEASQGEWRSYSEFLKSVSKWELLARRIGMGLSALDQRREAEESSRLGIQGTSPVRGPSILREMQESTLGPELIDGSKFFELGVRIDDACQTMKPSTSVFFLVGQAGLGKTELMLGLAKERSRLIAEDPTRQCPLYLFVSSTGRTLSSLEDAVDSALNITKVLSSHSAKALCRNGLLVLMVDGFDELLGSSGYENALGSLEPWFRELGGRGVLVASARSSYYLTQYRRSLASAVDLNVDHTLVELQPWKRNESEKYLKQMGVGVDRIKMLTANDWGVLGVPFFAKAFAAWIERNADTPRHAPSMYEIVVEQFLDRESHKLRTQTSEELLSTGELRELFSDVADLMQSSKSRELELSELVACAKMVVGEPLDEVRPGLSRRLSSLGGLGVRPDKNGQNQFGFSHEVLFDCFLLLAIQRRVSGVFNEKSLFSLLAASNINSAVFEWLIKRYPESAKILSSKMSFELKGEAGNQAASSNLGALWESLLNFGNGIPPTPSARGLAMNSVVLADGGWTSIDLSRSVISHLGISDNSEGEVIVSGATIEYLEVPSSVVAKRVLKGGDCASISSLKIGSSFADTPAQVARILHDAGILSGSIDSSDGEIIVASLHYLTRLIRRPDVPVIIDRETKVADDHRLSWINHYDGDMWTRFVSALVDSGAARLEPLATSGKAKVRLTFNIPVEEMVDRDSGRVEVERFWKGV